MHRGRQQMLMVDKIIERIGPQSIRLGTRVTGYRNTSEGTVAVQVSQADGTSAEVQASLLIGADLA